jgi:hypothetical protein
MLSNAVEYFNSLIRSGTPGGLAVYKTCKEYSIDSKVLSKELAARRKAIKEPAKTKAYKRYKGVII